MREEWSVGYKTRGEIKVAMGKANYACNDFNKALQVSIKNEDEGEGEDEGEDEGHTIAYQSHCD